MNHHHRLLVALCGALSAGLATGEPFTVVGDGRPTATIVLLPGSGDQAAIAAADLAGVLGRMTGRSFTTSTDAAASPALVVGRVADWAGAGGADPLQRRRRGALAAQLRDLVPSEPARLGVWRPWRASLLRVVRSEAALRGTSRVVRDGQRRRHRARIRPQRRAALHDPSRGGPAGGRRGARGTPRTVREAHPNVLVSVAAGFNWRTSVPRLIDTWTGLVQHVTIYEYYAVGAWGSRRPAWRPIGRRSSVASTSWDCSSIGTCSTRRSRRRRTRRRRTRSRWRGISSSTAGATPFSCS